MKMENEGCRKPRVDQELKISPEVSTYCAVCIQLPKNFKLDDKAVYKLV